MVILLPTAVLIMTLSTAFGVDIGLAPGLSLKNILLYAIGAAIAMRFVIARDIRFEVRGPAMLLIALVLVGLISTLITHFFVGYPGYDLVQALISLKAVLGDYLIFFLVFFCGLRGLEDSRRVLFAFLAIVGLGNLMSALHGAGILQFPGIPYQLSGGGRLQGVMGEHNQNGAFIAAFLPALVAMMLDGSARARLWWVVAVLASLAAALMSASRGGFVATLVSAAWGVFVFRRYIPLHKVLIWSIGGVLVLSVVVAAMSAQYGDMLAERVLGQTKSVDTGDLTSGRTVFWAQVYSLMVATPSSFLVGFGFDSYDLMPLRKSPHNTYLRLLFELGIIGMGIFVAALWQLVARSRRVLPRASAWVQPHLIAFSVGTVALAIAIFFVELNLPWDYYWIYAGIMMRMVLAIRDESMAGTSMSRDVPSTPAAAAPGASDRFGWASRAPG